MKIITVFLLAVLCAGCGYGSSRSSTAPKAGVKPVVTELSPDNVDAGSQGFTLTVNGSSFNSNAFINWNGAKQTTTFVTSGQLMTAVPASAVSTAGTAQVTVTNPGTAGMGGIYGGGGTAAATSTAVTFTIN